MLSTLPKVEIRRWTGAAGDGDDPEAAFGLLAAGAAEGVAGALVTLTAILGGAPRPLGTHMAVLADGRYAGYVSGGCVEAAVAAEALGVLTSGRDATLRFGAGSPFFDVRLPCGGGIDLLVSVHPEPVLVRGVLGRLAGRAAFSLELAPDLLRLAEDAPPASGWDGGVFRRAFLPRTRLIVVGRGPEFTALLRCGQAAGLVVEGFTPDEQSLCQAGALGIPATRLASLRDAPALGADAWTAVVFAFHDHEWELALLGPALASPAFYLGALGSRKTQAARCARLASEGYRAAEIARLRGPMGLFGPTRDARMLSLSVLAEIARERMALDS